MLPKIGSALDAVKNGVYTCHIIEGRVEMPGAARSTPPAKASARSITPALRQPQVQRDSRRARTTNASARRWSRAWIFDLDNTLHDARPHIFPHINRRDDASMCRRCSVMRPKRRTACRGDYWQRYGATLTGLMRVARHRPEGIFFTRPTSSPDLPRAMLVRSRAAALDAAPSPWAQVRLLQCAGALRARCARKPSGVADLFDAVFSRSSARATGRSRMRHGFLRLTRS